MTTTRIAMALGFAALGLGAPAGAATIVDEWYGVKVPPPPKIEDAVVDAKTTALLVLDFNAPICVPATNARCAAAAANAKKLLDAARAKGATVVYTTGGGGKPESIAEELKPMAGEPGIPGVSDKFYNTNLDKVLADKGVKTVVVTGVASNGAVLFTAVGAVRRDLGVVVPLDAGSAPNPYAEQLTAWQLANSPGQVGKIKITLTSKVTFQ